MVSVVEPAVDAREDKSAETTQKEEVASLTKQDSSSQSILASLVQPQSKVFHAPLDGNRKVTLEKHNVKMCGDLPENLADRGDLVAIDNVPEGEDSHPSTDPVTVITPPENLLLAEKSGGGAPREESGHVELDEEQLSSSEKDIPARRLTKPRLLVATSSETSSESGFHFSLTKEQLRPLMSTTPPPIRPVRHNTPDSEERSCRRSTIPDVVLPVLTETPGMSSQGVF